MPPTILITGGAGTLGQAVTPLLLGRGCNVRLLDVRRPERAGAGIDFVPGDVRRTDDVERAMDGVDAVVHSAAWHGVHLRDHPPRDFWSLNVDGTFVVYETAARLGVSRAVFSSTMGVYGDAARRPPEAPAIRVHENLPSMPTDIYGLSKVLGEETAALYHRSRGVRGIALRYGMFVPEPFLRYGVRLLYGGVDHRDVATAVVAALDTLEAEPDRPFRAYNIHSPVPYDERDAAHLAHEPARVLERHWAGARALLEAHGAELWGPVDAWYEVGRARHELHWRPRYDFGTFLDALRADITTIETIPPRGVGSGLRAEAR